MPPLLVQDVAWLRSRVGGEIGASEWMEIPQELISHFAEFTDDRQWIHIDPERCRAESPYGTTIAHGFLTLSFLSRLMRQIVEFRGEHMRVLNYGFNRVRFVAPVCSGARIRARATLTSLEPIPSGEQLTWDITVDVEGQAKPALVAEWIGRVYHA